jgi:D-inositol-3-phosphate glycosyltransferase
MTRKKHGLALNVPIILFVGRLVPKKGFQKLLEASGPEYELVLVGPGRVPDHVPAGATLLGPVSRKELRDLYQASDIFVFPAVGEMLTLAMQEAMACGLPVVATAEDAYSEYDLDQSGIALVPPEPDILRSTFLAILDDPVRMAHMQTYSRRLAAERFDWRRNSEHLASAYNRALDSARAPGRRARARIPMPALSSRPPAGTGPKTSSEL